VPATTQQLVVPVHAGLLPHSQAPFAHDSFAAHAAQVAALVPQDVTDCKEYPSHVPVDPPTQQPLAHVVESHAHVPFVVSHSPFVQPAQVAPPVPHEVGVCALQSVHVPVNPPLQQPCPQELALQTQLPEEPSQVRPDGQALHIAPPLPQEPPDCVLYASQVPVDPPLQQPIEHDVESHTHFPVVVLHSRPVPQLTHALPPRPHCVFVGVATQCWVVESQQPAHFVGSQTHCPALLQV